MGEAASKKGYRYQRVPSRDELSESDGHGNRHGDDPKMTEAKAAKNFERWVRKQIKKDKIVKNAFSSMPKPPASRAPTPVYKEIFVQVVSERMAFIFMRTNDPKLKGKLGPYVAGPHGLPVPDLQGTYSLNTEGLDFFKKNYIEFLRSQAKQWVRQWETWQEQRALSRERTKKEN